ncbi:hypothetical protein EMIT0111MI5_70053 [Burkholderia sp. IT-111MI5]
MQQRHGMYRHSFDHVIAKLF